MVSCVFPGSFDPVTVGHTQLISRAAGMFDRVTVAVMINIKKAGALSVDQRIDLLRKACSSFKNVRIVSWEGLLTDFMQKNDEKIIIRGIRTGTEFDQEMNAHYANRKLNDQIETIFLPADPFSLVFLLPLLGKLLSLEEI